MTTKPGRGQPLPIPVSFTLPTKLSPISVSKFHETILPSLEWSHVEVPYSRAESKEVGLMRAAWCKENLGPCALKWHNQMDSTITFDIDAAWFGYGSSIQHFYFKNPEHAVLFRVCQG